MHVESCCGTDTENGPSGPHEIPFSIYCEFCDQEYRSNVSTRWLSLEMAIERCLKQYPSLKAYFMSEDESTLTARFQRLKKWFENPIYLLFFQSILPTLNCTNKFLQRDEPLIHLLQPHLLSLVQKVLSKFVKPTFLVAGKSGYQF